MKKLIFFLGVFSFFPIVLLSQSVVIDKRAIKQVGVNTTAAVTAENKIADNFKKIRQIQEKVGKYILILEGNMERIDRAKQDVSAFKEGSKNCIVIVRQIGSCLQELQQLTVDVTKYPLGAAAYSKQIGGISERVVSIGASFIHNVTDGKVSIKGVPIEAKKVNLIDPIQRLEFTNQCLEDLFIVRQLIWQIRLNIYYRNKYYDAALSITPTVINGYHLSEKIAKDIISLWK